MRPANSRFGEHGNWQESREKSAGSYRANRRDESDSAPNPVLWPGKRELDTGKRELNNAAEAVFEAMKCPNLNSVLPPMPPEKVPPKAR
jgi:hypothetical protein